MANLTTIEKLIDVTGELTVAEMKKYKEGKELLEIIKANGIEVSEEDLLLEVAQKLSQNIGVGMKLLLKIDEELIASLIKVVEGDATSVEEITAETKEENIGGKEMENKTNGGKEIKVVTMELLEEIANLLAEERVTVVEMMEDYPQTKAIIDTFKKNGVRVVRKSQLLKLIEKAEENKTINKILAEIDYDNFIELLEEVRYDFGELICEETPVMSSKDEESSNNNKGGEKMKEKSKETKEEVKAENKQGGTKMAEEVKETTKVETEGGSTMEKEIKGGNAMKQLGVFGVNHRLQILNTRKYLNVLGTIGRKFGKDGLDEVDRIGTKIAVVSVKEKNTLKDILYRGGIVLVSELIKERIDNDFIEVIGSSIQGYQVIRIGYDLYKLYKSFNSITRKDIEDLNELLERLQAERDVEEASNEPAIPAIEG